MLDKSDTRCDGGTFCFPPPLFFLETSSVVLERRGVSFDFPQEPIGLLWFRYAMVLWAKRTTGRAPILWKHIIVKI